MTNVITAHTAMPSSCGPRLSQVGALVDDRPQRLDHVGERQERR